MLEAFRASVSTTCSEFAADIAHADAARRRRARRHHPDRRPSAASSTLFPDATLEVIPEVGHLIHYETPGDAAARILRFLALRSARVRIVVDCRYTRIGQHDGISRFTAGIVTELGKRHPLTMLISDHRQLDMLPALPWQLVSSPTSIREPLVALQVKKLRPDVVFTPMQTMGSWGRDYKLLLTLHDLIYYENRTPPRDLPLPVAAALAALPPRLVAAADAPEPRRRASSRFPRRPRGSSASTTSPTGPITVVPNAADELGAPALPRARPEGHRLVYMGSYMPYKNVDTLVRAVAALPDHELHLMSRISRDERARLTRLAPQARLVFHDGATRCRVRRAPRRRHRARHRLAGRGLRHPARRGHAPRHAGRRQRHPDLPRDRRRRGAVLRPRQSRGARGRAVGARTSGGVGAAFRGIRRHRGPLQLGDIGRTPARAHAPHRGAAFATTPASSSRSTRSRPAPRSRARWSVERQSAPAWSSPSSAP